MAAAHKSEPTKNKTLAWQWNQLHSSSAEPAESEASKWSDWHSKERGGTPPAATKAAEEKAGDSGSAAYTFDPMSLSDGRGLAKKAPVHTGIASDLSRKSDGRVVDEEYNWADDWAKSAKQRLKEVAEKYVKTPEDDGPGGCLSEEEDEDAELRKGKRELLPQSWESVGEAETESACVRTGEEQQPSAAVVRGLAVALLL